MEILCNVFKYISIVILIVGSLCILPMFFQFHIYAVASDSMEPTIPTGSMLYVRYSKFDNFQLNDIVSFKKGNLIVTHRIVGIDTAKQELTTKGDSIRFNDEEKVPVSNIIGKAAISLPFLGYILMYIKEPIGIIAGGLFLMLFILSIFLPDILKGRKK